MAQSVVYADLKFATAPQLPAPAGPTAPDEDDSPYENVPLGPVPVEPTPDWQVTRSLQNTSREHEAEQGRLSQEVSTRQESLEQTRMELALARAELQRAWQEGNSSQLELESLQKKMQEVQAKLISSESTVSSLRACVNTECCPLGWVLYKNVCLFISGEKKSCQQSCQDCRDKGARLLVQGKWNSWNMPDIMKGSSALYWIGTKIPSDIKWCHSSGAMCELLTTNRKADNYKWKLYQWICEKPPELTTASKSLRPLLDKA
ncbi:PREDICTED: B-cell differentiation antigen CD72-like [Calidris pugnax]|uniref:B-cell differentiation antigen CD72-like n=1 Tax=Calidris pugnax TaxID=198806 RepID=UPI00071D1302|nr:PREDICTED: B-cell differentiation antigen CD72-like [Calidris pugnax]